jgi:hypothetical protein
MSESLQHIRSDLLMMQMTLKVLLIMLTTLILPLLTFFKHPIYHIKWLSLIPLFQIQHFSSSVSNPKVSPQPPPYLSFPFWWFSSMGHLSSLHQWLALPLLCTIFSSVTAFCHLMSFSFFFFLFSFFLLLYCIFCIVFSF